MRCSQCIELFDDYIDGVLTRDTMEKIQAHLRECKHCRVIFHTYSLTIRLSKSCETFNTLSKERIKKLKQTLTRSLRMENKEM